MAKGTQIIRNQLILISSTYNIVEGYSLYSFDINYQEV